MAAQLHSIRQTLEKNGEDVISALHQLNTILDYSTREDIIKAASIISVQLLFGFLSSSDEELIEICCGALEKILKVIEPQEICQHRGYIELGLQHPFERVRQTCLDTLAAFVGDPNIQEMLNTPTVFHLVNQTVGDPSLKCASEASNILFHLATERKCNGDALAAELQGVMHKDSIVRCRVYELAVKIAVSNDTQLACLTSILLSLVQEVDNNDVLVQLNCVELLVLLTGSLGGYQFVVNHQIVAKLHSLLSMDQYPLAMMFVPGALKFFGCISRLEGSDVESMCLQYPGFLHTLLEAIHHPEQDTTWGIAVDTFGVLGSFLPGRKALKMSGSQLDEALKLLGRLIREGRSEVRVRSMHTLNTILSCPDDDQETRVWLNVVLLHPGVTLLSIARQPFPDLHMEALGVVLTMVQKQWGQQEMKVVPGFVEYLLDRRTETERLGKQLKYDILHALVSSGTAEKEFGSSVFVKFRKYDREGPFFAGETMVAFEES